MFTSGRTYEIDAHPR